jgi:AcrR family transcriptional regulator
MPASVHAALAAERAPASRVQGPQRRTAAPVTHASRGPGRPGYDVTRLLAAAVEVFNERGYDGTTMEDLARRLGITKSAIYHHVDGKEALLRLALDRALDGLFEVAAQTRSLDAGAIVRLEHLVRGSVRVLVDDLPYVTLLLRVRGNSAIERRALQRRRQFDRLVANLLEEAQVDGDVRPEVDPGVTARLLFGTVNSIVEWYRSGRPLTSEQLADAVCALVFDGLREPDGVSARP